MPSTPGRSDDHSSPALRGCCILLTGKFFSDKIETKDGSNYSFTGLIRDKAGNSGKNTKVECTLVVDVESPDVSIQQPELLTGEYGYVKALFEFKNLLGVLGYFGVLVLMHIPKVHKAAEL